MPNSGVKKISTQAGPGNKQRWPTQYSVRSYAAVLVTWPTASRTRRFFRSGGRIAMVHCHWIRDKRPLDKRPQLWMLTQY